MEGGDDRPRLGLPLMPFLYRSIVLIATASTPCMAFPAFSISCLVSYLSLLCFALPCVNSPILLLLLRSQPHLALPSLLCYRPPLPLPCSASFVIPTLPSRPFSLPCPSSLSLSTFNPVSRLFPLPLSPPLLMPQPAFL
jgi:hypothetical protein